MRDVTDVFGRFRACAQAIWNLCFWQSVDLRDWDSRDAYRDILVLLFEALVLRTLGVSASRSEIFSKPLPAFELRPGSPDGAPVRIERPRPGDRNHYWDDPVQRLGPSDAKLHFVDYFDWNEIGRAHV